MTLPRTLGRYTLYDAIGTGGMATVHYARLRGNAGFTRSVAVKLMHWHLARDVQLADLLKDEARVAGRIVHPHVVQTIDVIDEAGELALVFELVIGETLAALARRQRERKERCPVPIACGIVAGALRGAHAAHEAKDERGAPLDLVHRDISPHNIMVDEHGVARVLDFGIAKARGRAHVTKTGELKGKIGYMAPEQIHGNATRASDVFAMGIVLWELLAGRALFQRATDAETLAAIMTPRIERPSVHHPGVSEALDEIVMKSLKRSQTERFATALEMAEALEAAVPVAAAPAIANWLDGLAGEALREQRRIVDEMMASPPVVAPVAPSAPLAPARPEGRPASRRSAILAGALACGWLATIGVMSTHRHAPSSPPPEPAVSIVAPAPSVGSAMPGSVASASPAAPSPPEREIESAESTKGASAPASNAPPPRPRNLGPDRKRPRAAGTGRNECDPPYTIDEKGRVEYKRECF